MGIPKGSYGSTPKSVLKEYTRLTDIVESNPDKFHRLEYQPLLISVRERLAKFIGAHVDEVVMVPNASYGLNTILRDLDWKSGDIVIGGESGLTLRVCNAHGFIATTSYNSIINTMQYISDTCGVQMSTFILHFPTTISKILTNWKTHLRSITSQRSGSQKIVAVIDSIASNPGVLLPWKEMVAFCREEGVMSVIDGAHSIGQEPDINLGLAQPDFWVSVSISIMYVYNLLIHI